MFLFHIPTDFLIGLLEKRRSCVHAFRHFFKVLVWTCLAFIINSLCREEEEEEKVNIPRVYFADKYLPVWISYRCVFTRSLAWTPVRKKLQPVKANGISILMQWLDRERHFWRVILFKQLGRLCVCA